MDRSRARLAVTVGLASVLAACGPADPPAPGPAGALPAAEAKLAWPAGDWPWTWQGGGRTGQAVLHVGGGRWSWRLLPPPPPGQEVALAPADTQRWERQRVPAGAADAAWLPLPRWPAASPDYASVAALLAALVTPRFDGVVTAWPRLPVPVRIGAARSGDLDLAACLRAAMDRWNDGAEPPWFAASDSADWGVRLVHLPGRRLSPPLYAQITRLDDDGHPLRVHIVAGDNYDDARDSVYAVRGFVHELGHALLLWGHSTDRAHVLWGAAPPLVDAPSLDERKAAQLLHGLPPGLDLSRYGAPIPP
ncbi:MAG TPA: hypothetical protein PLQ13_11350 [Candidatus Krumholzibacteria bacterium]|nr:hypothetical protein [Candidatus Krumholzibacteria bacterium]